jgi:hypothetical protein
MSLYLGTGDVGFERISTQDIGFGLRHLTDVAIKARLAGINDSVTARQRPGHWAALLCEVADRGLGVRDHGATSSPLRTPPTGWHRRRVRPSCLSASSLTFQALFFANSFLLRRKDTSSPVPNAPRPP